MTMRARWWLGAGLAMTVAAGGALSAACWGGDDAAVCGDGRVDGEEQCDDGNTSPYDSCNNCYIHQAHNVTIRWTMLSDVAPGFSGEACTSTAGVGADGVHVVVSGPQPSDQVIGCTYSQTTLTALPDGDYTVEATLVQGEGAAAVPITNPVTATFTVPTSSVTVNFGFEDFLLDYTGQFLFEVTWAGADTCDGATPPVARHIFRLERDGVALEGVTDVGDVIDGSASGACRPVAGAYAQFIPGLPWGPATFTITGLDSSGTPRYQGSFPTFIGAGTYNPTLAFDVPLIGADAGPADAAPVDAAPVDAPVPDAPVQDAGTPDAT